MFTAVDKNLLYSRHDKNDPRLGEWVKPVAYPPPSEIQDGIIVLGYPDDEGIRLNKGRPGAHLGPDAIRNFLYRMTSSAFSASLYDLGNLNTLGLPIQQRHQNGKEAIKSIQQKTLCSISFGGGHDYGYSDGAGFLEVHAKKSSLKPLIINFDAHLDVRPLDHGITSGTPFFRLLTEYPNQFDFIEIGIQKQCNSMKHLQWVQDLGATVIGLETIRRSSLLEICQSVVESSIDRKVYLSVDIDAFCLAEAPGCSQSWPTGIKIQEFLPAFQYLLKSFSVTALGIYEVSPPLDSHDSTSKLAAQIAYEFICRQHPG